MSYVLSKASYESAESLVKKDLLAYIDYGSPKAAASSAGRNMS